MMKESYDNHRSAVLVVGVLALGLVAAVVADTATEGSLISDLTSSDGEAMERHGDAMTKEEGDAMSGESMEKEGDAMTKEDGDAMEK